MCDIKIVVIRYCNDKLNQEHLCLVSWYWGAEVVKVDTLLPSNDPIFTAVEPTAVHR